MEAAGAGAKSEEFSTMSHDHAHEPVNNDPPSQGTFVGWLALALLAFALLVAATGIIAGLTHTPII